MCYMDTEKNVVIHSSGGNYNRTDARGMYNTFNGSRTVHPKYGGRDGCSECIALVNELIETIVQRKLQQLV